MQQRQAIGENKWNIDMKKLIYDYILNHIEEKNTKMQRQPSQLHVWISLQTIQKTSKNQHIFLPTPKDFLWFLFWIFFDFNFSK